MKTRNEKGGTIVEFVVVAPVLLLILFGIIEMGFLLYDKAVLTNASREGARAGIVFSDPRLTSNQIAQIVNNYCSTYLISFAGGATPSVNVQRSGTSHGDSLTVTVTYPYQFLVLSSLSGLFGGGIGGNITLNAQSVMRLE
jgi:Flp pilus assembly protein TadG